jgi:hypothetical protein
MSTQTKPPQARSTDFQIDTSTRSPGLNKAQQVGGRLWFPMFAMALMAFAAGFIVSLIQAGELSDNGVSDTTATLNHVKAGLMFIGFASVFSAITFAIARILGVFRSGGGEVQELTGRPVHTMKMPPTAKLMMAGMMMAMMLILIPVALHFVYAFDVTNTAASIELAEERFIVLEGFRRLGVAVYLAAIAFGLATIIKVLRFQAIRIRELPES